MKSETNNNESIFKRMAAKWPSPLVARKQVAEFSGGLINPRTLSNMDSAGTGPKERMKVGGTVVYPVDSFVEWLEARVVKSN